MQDPAGARGKLDDIYVAKAISFIEEHQKNHRGSQFFVYLPLQAIHAAAGMPARLKGKSELGDREDKILWANESVDKILATIDRLDLKDDTLVIFTSDNGPINRPVGRKKGHLAAARYCGFAGVQGARPGARVPFPEVSDFLDTTFQEAAGCLMLRWSATSNKGG